MESLAFVVGGLSRQAYRVSLLSSLRRRRPGLQLLSNRNFQKTVSHTRPPTAQSQTNWEDRRVKAVVVDPKSIGHLTISEIAEPVPDATDTLVRVKAFSVNRGEVRGAATALAGNQIGWDFSGVVEKSARDGTGPKSGQHVVGFSRRRQGWAEKVAVPSRDVAVVPDAVSIIEAATLPVAGLTALYTLERCDRLLCNRVLVTGATGGVGFFACQLARLMGAKVTAQVRRAEQQEFVQELGVELLVTASGEQIPDQLRFRAIIDGIGGDLLARLLPLLEEDGRAILYGVSGGSETQLQVRNLMFTGSGRIEGFHLYRESEIEAAHKGLERLLVLVGEGKLKTLISSETDWSDVGTVAQRLIDRSFAGKAVLKVP
jgi:NADPH:quinone reductase